MKAKITKSVIHGKAIETRSEITPNRAINISLHLSSSKAIIYTDFYFSAVFPDGEISHGERDNAVVTHLQSKGLEILVRSIHHEQAKRKISRKNAFCVD